MSSPENDDWRPIAVTLPARYRITVLALVDRGVAETIAPKLKALREQGAQPKQLPDELTAALMGPVFARGEIVHPVTTSSAWLV